MRTPVYRLLLAAALISGPAIAQTNPTTPPPISGVRILPPDTRIRIHCATTVNDSAKPLVVIDTFVTQLEYLVLEAANIESINVLNNKAATEQWGERGKGGVIVITPARTSRLLTLQQLFEYYNVAAEDRKLKVSIDGKPVDHPELILVDPKALSGVSTYVSTTSPEQPAEPQKFFNIIPRKGPVKKE